VLSAKHFRTTTQ